MSPPAGMGWKSFVTFVSKFGCVKHLLYLNKYFVKYRWRLTLGVIFVSLSNYFAILIPQEIGKALDYVQEQIKSYKVLPEALKPDAFDTLGRALLVFGGTVVAFMVIKGVLMYFMRQTIIYTSRLIEYDLRKEIFAHLERLDTGFYRTQKTGDLMARITEDVSKVRNYLGPGILYGINLISLFAFTIYAMFSVNTELAIYTLIPLPILSISIYYVSSLINEKSTIIQQQLSKLTTISQEAFSGIRVLKSYGKEAAFSGYFEDQSEEFRQNALSLVKVNAYFYPLMILLINCSTLIVLLVGGHKVSSQAVSAGNIAEFIIYVNMLTWPVTAIGWIASVIQEAEASQQRINELLEVKPNIVSASQDTAPIKGHVKFENVGLVYADTGIEALNNINFELLPGERLGIIGRTASGKTSIAELLLRMFDPTSGTITLDGRSLQEHNISNLRSRIAYVPQDVFLFSDTVQENIAFGVNAEKNTIEEVQKYAGYASIHEEILRLPDGYQTMVGERGVTLSGGQKQRISIARALMKQPDLVVLDDCLSAVDTVVEQMIIDCLDREMKDKTSIIITHRISSQLNLDKVLVLDHGQIVEYGTPEELIRLNGYYVQLLEQSRLVEQ